MSLDEEDRKPSLKHIYFPITLGNRPKENQDNYIASSRDYDSDDSMDEDPEEYMDSYPEE